MEISTDCRETRPSLTVQVNIVTNGCTSCGDCVKECAFLKKYGSPKTIAAVAAVQLTGGTHYLQQDRLQVVISSYGALAPAVYILIYAVAPVLFLPGLPITIVGGILFGPFWGVVYTLTGSTIGASLAFLTARYAARDWVAAKLTSPKWA